MSNSPDRTIEGGVYYKIGSPGLGEVATPAVAALHVSVDRVSRA